MADQRAAIDVNNRRTLLAVTDDAAAEIRRVLVDPTTGRLKCSAIIDMSAYVTTSQTTPQTIGDTTNRLLKLWATDITVTNSIVGSVTGNAGTVTGLTLTTNLTNNGGSGTLTWPAAGATLTIPTGGGTLGSAAFTASSDYATAAQGTLATNAMPKGGGTFTGNVLFTDNTLDIGASGATRPRTIYLGTSVVSPSILASANDSGALGASGIAFSDLFLASGGVINWNAGNATLTHSTGLLTSNVPLSLGTSNALTCGTIELGDASDTTIARVSAGVVSIEGNNIITANNKAAGSDVTTGTDDAKFVTSKALADADVNTRLKSKIITFTRDVSASSGDVSYTGVGFVPTSLMIIGAISSTFSFSIGFADSSRADASLEPYVANTMQATSDGVIKIATSAGNDQYAVVKSYDADGFTLTWTKEGSPTGTATFYAICYR